MLFFNFLVSIKIISLHFRFYSPFRPMWFLNTLKHLEVILYIIDAFRPMWFLNTLKPQIGLFNQNIQILHSRKYNTTNSVQALKVKHNITPLRFWFQTQNYWANCVCLPKVAINQLAADSRGSKLPRQLFFNYIYSIKQKIKKASTFFKKK